LKQQISVGALSGQLTISKLASDFSVSSLPVREALRRLEAEGLVHFNKRRVTVTELTVEGLRELFDIRLALEPLLLEGCVPELSSNAGLLDALRKDMEMMDRADLSFEDWMEANRVFHQRMYTVASRHHLRSIVLTLWAAVEPYLRIYANEASVLSDAQVEHKELLNLIEAGNGPGAARLLSVHLKNTLSATENYLLSDIRSRNLPADQHETSVVELNQDNTTT
jgi:DNA-binding GntR family transcriptional regulator